jgi:hypothetical protein
MGWGPRRRQEMPIDSKLPELWYAAPNVTSPTLFVLDYRFQANMTSPIRRRGGVI